LQAAHDLLRAHFAATCTDERPDPRSLSAPDAARTSASPAWHAGCRSGWPKELNTMLKKTISLLTLAFALAASAGTARADCANDRCDDVQVSELYLHNGHQRLLVSTNGVERNLGNCAAIQNNYIAVPKAHALFEQIYSLLLAAQLSGKSVTLRTLDTPGGECTVVWAAMN
jgi:hypothetical protein